MKTSSCFAQYLVLVTLLLPILTASANASPTVPDQRLVGQWHGQSRFTGISYEEATQKRVAVQTVELTVNIAAEGTVTGHVGGAEFTGCVVTANRGWFGRLFHLWTDFIIRGSITGPVTPGSEPGSHTINAPFNLTTDGKQITGTLFATYPVKYPYPFINLHLGR